MRYTVGGSIAFDSDVYIERKTDAELLSLLLEGQFCSVLNARQMGKTSLLNRIASQLREHDVESATIDLGLLGKEGHTRKGWYQSFIKSIAYELDLPIQQGKELIQWFEEQKSSSPSIMLRNFFIEVALPAIDNKGLVILVDEIDVVQGIEFISEKKERSDNQKPESPKAVDDKSKKEQSEDPSSKVVDRNLDDFFRFIKAITEQKRRSDQKLCFCLFGAATPNDLIENLKDTVLNVGETLSLSGLTEQEAAPLAVGMTKNAEDPYAVLREIISWTDGQPYLIQRLCDCVQKSSTKILKGCESEYIEELVCETIVDGWESRDPVSHLNRIQAYLVGTSIDSNDAHAVSKAQTAQTDESQNIAGSLLDVYEKALDKGVASIIHIKNAVQKLKISGVLIDAEGGLSISRIYERVFNKQWIERSRAQLRPAWYAKSFNAWMASGRQSTDYLLKETELENAIKLRDRRQLSLDDEKFVRASINLERENLEKANSTIGGKLKLSIWFLILSIVTAAGFSLYAGFQYRKAEYIRRRSLEVSEIEQLANDSMQTAQVADLYRPLSLSLRSATRLKNLVDSEKLEDINDYPTVVPLLALEQSINGLIAMPTVLENMQSVEVSPNEELVFSIVDTVPTIAYRNGEIVSELEDKGYEPKSVQSVFSPDSKKIAMTDTVLRPDNSVSFESVQEDNTTIRVWNFDEEIFFTLNYKASVISMAFSPDGKHFVVLYEDGKVKVLNLKSTYSNIIQEPGEYIVDVSFSPDSKRLLLTASSNKMSLWDIADRKDAAILTSLEEEDNSFSNDSSYKDIIYAKVLPDSKGVIAITDHSGDRYGIYGGFAYHLDLEGNVINSFKIEGKPIGEIIRLSDYEPLLVTKFEDGRVRVWNLLNGESVTLDRHAKEVRSVFFSAELNQIVTVGQEGIVAFWNPFGSFVSELSLSPEEEVYSFHGGTFLSTSSTGSTNKIWDILPSTQEILGKEHINKNLRLQARKRLRVHSYSDKVISYPDYLSVVVWSVANRNYVVLRDGDSYTRSTPPPVIGLTGDMITTSPEPEVIYIWDSSGNKIKTITAEKDRDFTRPIISPNESMIAMASEMQSKAQEVLLWDSIEDRIYKLEHESWVIRYFFSPDNKHLLTHGDGVSTLWDIESRRKIGEFSVGDKVPASEPDKNPYNLMPDEKYEFPINVGEFSSDNNYILATTSKNEVTVWERSGKLVTKITSSSEDEFFQQAVFLSDGSKVLTVSNQSKVQIWSTIDGELLTSFTTESEPVEAILSPDESFFVLLMSDNNLQIWNSEGEKTGQINSSIRPVITIFNSDSNLILTTHDKERPAQVKVWTLSGQLLSSNKMRDSSKRNYFSFASPRLGYEYNRIMGADFLNDGKGVYTTVSDGLIRVSPLRTLDELISEGCQRLQEYQDNGNQILESDQAVCDL